MYYSNLALLGCNVAENKGKETTEEKSKPVEPDIPKSINEAIRRMAGLLINPPADRLPSFVPMQGYQVYDVVLSCLRERAYDLTRNPQNEPLSKVERETTLQCLMGKGKYHMLLGNLAIGGLSGTEESPIPKNITKI